MQDRIPDKSHYDKLYRSGYMSDFGDLYEYCRLKTVLHTLKYLRVMSSPQSVLDVGCGQGRYLAIVKSIFSSCHFSGIDIADGAITLAKKAHPDVELFVGKAETMDMFEDNSFDLLINIEILEHVEDVDKTVAEFARVLRPGGWILFTTPCANKFSVEWLENFLRGTIEKTRQGFSRFGTDPFEHVRRLTGNDMQRIFERHGLSLYRIRYRGHFFTRFSYLAYQYLKKRYGTKYFKFFGELAYLDWHFFRWLPNGTTMVGLAQKSIS